ncbi:MAG: sugar transferase [Pseudorhodobacter sp.]|nr:sugar transferase [Pseudorhodobacter sp.]
MTPAKRALDLVMVAILLVLVGLPFLCLLAVMLLVEGRPLFYVAERMKSPDQPFNLWKLRTMRPAGPERGVSGGDKRARITRFGAFCRRVRADEVPQLWNVLKGDMSIVGPRPPLRDYTDRFPELYRQVLQSRPGITGLASLRYHETEERLLAPCLDAAAVDHVYATRCVPRKARLDLIYQRHQSLCFDLVLIWETGTRVLLRRVFRLE